MIDSFKHQGLRKKLVEQLKTKGITNNDVLAAIGKVPRHSFMESALDIHAYQDKAFPIAANQTISQPYTVAFQTELLKVKKGDKILEVGTGSGYQSAVLVEMKAKVYTIERQRELYIKVQTLLPKLKYRPQFFFGDGYKGLPTYAPFSGIVVTAGAPFIPEALLPQLKIGGKLVIPVGDSENQIMTCVTRISDDKYETKEYGNFMFVPLLEGTN